MSWLKRLTGGKKVEPKRSEPPREAAKPDLRAIEAAHRRNTEARVAAYEELFGCTAKKAFPYHELAIVQDEPFMIDVFVFDLATERFGDVDVTVTNGMSDQRMVDPEDHSSWGRRELIQYLPTCTRDHAQRLHRMAWAPLDEGFFLDTCHTMAWRRAAVEGTPWTSAFFLQPLLRSHQDFEVDIDGDPVSLLWHIPISEAEREFKVQHGANALIDRMDAVDLPWVVDEANRPSLLPQ